jgi:hypothetical protein
MDQADLVKLFKKHRPKKGPHLADNALAEFADIEILNQYDDARRKARQQLREIIDEEVVRLSK